MWGTDATSCLTTREGNATVFIAVDHCTQECIGIHAARPGTRFEALEPLRQGLREHFDGYEADLARGLALRHDHGSQYLSDHFQEELRFLGIRSSPSFVAAPEGNGCAERFIRTLKEQLLWVGALRDGGGATPGAARFQGALQPALARRPPRPPHPSRRPRGALAEHRGGRMITASGVSKKPGAVHRSLTRERAAPSSVWRYRTKRSRRLCCKTAPVMLERSLSRRVIATYQPRFSSPTICSAGTRTSSKKSSLISCPHAASMIGRTVRRPISSGRSRRTRRRRAPRAFAARRDPIRHPARRSPAPRSPHP